MNSFFPHFPGKTVIVVRSSENISARLAGDIGKKLKIATSQPVLLERDLYTLPATGQ